MTKSFKLDDAPIMYLIALLLQIVMAVFLPLFSKDVGVYMGYLLPQVAYIAVLLIYTRVKKYPLRVVVPIKKKTNLVALLCVVLVTIGVYMQNLLLSVSFSWAMLALGVKMSVTIPPLNSALSIFLAILLLCILPAIGEESIFRGVFVTGLKNERGAIFAIFVSAAIFSISHLNPAQLVHQFIFGVVLAYIVVRTENIIFPMIIHFINNLFAVVLPLIIPGYNNLGVMSGQSAAIMAIMMVVGIIILYPSLRMLIKFGSPTPISYKESGLINFFVAKKAETLELKKTKTYSLWLIMLIVALSVALIANTIMLSFPNLLGK